MPDQPEADERRRAWSRYLELSQVGTEMVSPIVIGLLLDWKWETGPWLTVAGAFLGFFWGMYHMLNILNRTQGPPQNRSEPK
jgi:F0F1-type ATP synthase assembly protein I